MWRSDVWWVSYLNFLDEVRKNFKLPKKVVFHDITLRDGEQQASIVFRKEDKIEIARALDEVGVHRIEAGMPAISRDDMEAVKAIVKEGLNAKIFCFSRCMRRDVDLALECDVDGVVMEIPSSEHLIKHGYRWPLEKAMELAIDATAHAAQHGLHVAFFTIDGTRTDLNWWISLVGKVAKEGHMDSLVLVDTFGVCIPEAIRYFVRKAREHFDKPLEAHFHNDFGLAVANTLAAVSEGVEIIHTTVNGIGERTGGADLAETALALKLLYGVDIDIRFDKLRKLARLVEKLSGIKMPPQKPVVGEEIFSIESGIIVGWLRNALECSMPLITFPYHWSLVGHEGVKIVLGKKSGRDSIIVKLEEMKIDPSIVDIDKVLEEVKDRSIKLKKPVSDEDFKRIVENARRLKVH